MPETDKTIVLLGWDAATWDLLLPWVEQGRLPNLAALMKAGCHGVLQSTPLPVSPAAWTSIITGQNPARHGVFDWFERKPHSYDVEYVHTGRIASQTLWQYVNKAGKRVGVFNLPMVYPAVPVDGFMVSGLAAPHHHAPGFAYPPDLVEQVEASIGPFISTEPQVFRSGGEREYLQSLLEWVQYQEEVVLYLLEHDPCDVSLFVFMQSDHAQHKFWRYLDPAFPGYDEDHDHQFQEAIFLVFQALDGVLGRLRERMPENTVFILLSDHGAGPMHGVMHVNRWLMHEGLLHLRRTPATLAKYFLARTDIILKMYRLISRLGLGNVAKLASKQSREKVLSSFLTLDDVDWSRTKAYGRGSYGQIYVNLKGREPRGIVEPGQEYEDTIQDILIRLRSLRHPETGEPLITNPCRRAELFPEEHPAAADIFFSIQDYRYQASSKLAAAENSFLGPSAYEDSGSHRLEGVLVMAGPGVKSGQELPPSSVVDVLPTVLALADIPVPTWLDGKPILAALTAQQAQHLRYTDQEINSAGANEAPVLTEEEKEDLEDRLRSLGYLG